MADQEAQLVYPATASNGLGIATITAGGAVSVYTHIFYREE